jgi:hypothetical protein
VLTLYKKTGFKLQSTQYVPSSDSLAQMLGWRTQTSPLAIF